MKMAFASTRMLEGIADNTVGYFPFTSIPRDGTSEVTISSPLTADIHGENGYRSTSYRFGLINGEICLASQFYMLFNTRQINKWQNVKDTLKFIPRETSNDSDI